MPEIQQQRQSRIMFPIIMAASSSPSTQTEAASSSSEALTSEIQLKDAYSNFVSNAIAKIYVAKIGSGITGTEMEATSTGAATVGNLFRYDSTSNQYIFNLGTKSLSTGTWQIRIELDDGTSKYATISLK